MRYFIVALLGALLLLSERALSQTPAPATTVPDLAVLYQADQAERAQLRALTSPTELKTAAAAMAAHDAQRRGQVRALIQSHTLRTSQDYRMAATILQHGVSAEDYALAHALATLGSTLAPDDKALRRLAAATTDRWLLSRQPQQWYGTQSVCDARVKPPTCKLEVIDSAVSDAERDAAGLAPLAQLRSENAAREHAMRERLVAP
jgi:hypothetical protein